MAGRVVGAGCEQASSFRKKFYLKLHNTVVVWPAGARHPTHPTSQFICRQRPHFHAGIKAHELERLGKTYLSLSLSHLCFNCCYRHCHTAYLICLDLIWRSAERQVSPSARQRQISTPASQPSTSPWRLVCHLFFGGAWKGDTPNQSVLFEPTREIFFASR